MKRAFKRAFRGAHRDAGPQSPRSHWDPNSCPRTSHHSLQRVNHGSIESWQDTLALVDDGLHPTATALPRTLPGAHRTQRRRVPLSLGQLSGQVFQAAQHLTEVDSGF